MKNLVLLTVSVFLVGCLPTFLGDLTPKMKNFQYSYKVEGKNKSQIWKLTRNHFALVYGDVRSVLRVQDEEEGTLIGKGKVKWSFDPPINSLYCWHDYNILFTAEDGKANLKLALIEGGTCRLTEEGYKVIKNDFRVLNIGLKNALR